jgi:ATP-binding protein involved in chromosome partitioning
MSDPRLAVIEKRLRDVRRVIAVSSGKGGVGKSMIATALALHLREEGHAVGLLDLDFTSPATHVILGVEGLYPEEEHGIVPPTANGLSYMSITYYSVDEPTPLRGMDVSNAIIELLAITRWGELDYLIVDMPPGIGDATLDTLRLMPRIEFIVATTPSRVAFQSVRRLLVLLKDMDVPIIGVVENMVMKPNAYVREEVERLGLEYLGSVDYDEGVEEALGDPEALQKTLFYEELETVSQGL